MNRSDIQESRDIECPDIAVELAETDAIDHTLESPWQDQNLGGTPDLTDENMAFHVCSRPMAFSVQQIYKASGNMPPGDAECLMDHRLWLVVYCFSIVREPGTKRAERVVFKVDYGTSGAMVMDMLPRTEFLTIVDTTLGGGVQGVAAFNLDGMLLDALISDPGFAIPGGGNIPGVNVTAYGQGSIAGHVRFSIRTPAIITYGKWDSWGQWEFFRHADNPMVGDYAMIHILSVPRTITQLHVEASLKATLSTRRLLRSTRASAPIPILVELPYHSVL